MLKHNNRKTLSLIGLALAVITLPGRIEPMSIRAMVALAFGMQVGKGPVLKKCKAGPAASLGDLYRFLKKVDSDKLTTARDATKLIDSKYPGLRDDLWLEVYYAPVTRQGDTRTFAQGGAMLVRDIKQLRPFLQGYADNGGDPFRPQATPWKTELAKRIVFTNFGKADFVQQSLEKDEKQLLSDYIKLLGDDDPLNRIENFNAKTTKELLKVDPFTVGTLDEQTGFTLANAWRRLALLAEGEVVWFMDWFSIGPKVGIAGDLFKLVSNDNPSLSITTPFHLKAGLTMGFSKWFSVDLLLSLTRCTLEKEKISATGNQTVGQAAVLESIKEKYKDFQDTLKFVLDESDKAKDWQKKIDGLDLDKLLGDRYTFSGWSWGVSLRASVNLWINEFLAARIGLDWNIPFTDVSGKDATGDQVSFSPAQKVSPYVGLVFAII